MWRNKSYRVPEITPSTVMQIITEFQFEHGSVLIRQIRSIKQFEGYRLEIVWVDDDNDGDTIVRGEE